jgi:predicted AlkP superfamily pyrophosphatase or phosphodiesterase
VTPSRSGIVGNQWFERQLQKTVNCVEDLSATLLGSDSPGRSPRNLLVKGIGDWIKDHSPGAKVFSASRKDRGAILLAGHKSNGSFWYNGRNGRFITSDYYMKSLPDWVGQFHAKDIPGRYFGKSWTPLPVFSDDAARSGVDIVPVPSASVMFLHETAGPAGERFFSAFGGTPFMDEYLMEFAKSLIEAEGLGQDGSVDLLGLSFSALDSVGHSYGPHSPEILDALLRLDQYLGKLLDFVDAKVGLDNVLLVLSADHGVMPLPEKLAREGIDARRLSSEDYRCHQEAFSSLESKFGTAGLISREKNFNRELIEEKKLSLAEIEKWLKDQLESCPSVAKVWSFSDLTGARGVEDPFEKLYRNNYHPERSPDLQIQLKEFRLAMNGRGTSHGSPYRHDRHVPIIVWVPNQPGRIISDPVRTVDIAPTLISILGIRPPENLDGRDLTGLMAKGGP